MKVKSVLLLLILLIPLSVMAGAKYDMTVGTSAGNLELVSKAFDGVDMKTKIDALMSSSLSGKLNVVKFLISKGVDVNAKGELGKTSLMYAAGNGHLEIVKYLVQKGADVQAKNLKGNTTLIIISSMGRPEVVKYLISKGANVNAKGEDGVTALMRAQETQQVKTTEYLISSGADVNARNTKGDTALAIASSYYGSYPVIKILISHGADVNAKNTAGETVLMKAVNSGNTLIMEYLISQGADVNAKDKDAKTALNIAKAKNHKEVVKLLKKYGAKSSASEVVEIVPNKKHGAKISTSEVVELVPLKKLGIRKIFISSANNIVEKWPAEFPSGTNKLQVVLILDVNLRYGVGLDTLITFKSEKLKIQPQGGVGRFNLSNHYYVTQDILPSVGNFEDGVYHCVVKLDGKDIAEFSWSVGSKS